MAIEEVVLQGDFNSRTRALHIPLHDRTDDILCIEEIDPKLVGLQHMSDNVLELLTTYG